MRFFLSTLIAYFTAAPLLHAQGLTSPWPRRPEVLDQARLLAIDERYAEATDKLRPYLSHAGVAGSDIRRVYSSLMMRLYMNREHPKAFVYTVQSGDHLRRIAQKTNCSPGLLMLINGIIDPARLRVGQKLVALPLQLHIVVYEQESEIALWDDDTMLASYPLEKKEGNILPSALERRVSTVSSYRSGKKLRTHLNVTGDRVVEISGGIYIAGEQKLNDAFAVYRLPQELLNEWAFFILKDTPVSIVAKGEIKAGESPKNMQENENDPHPIAPDEELSESQT